MVPGALVRTKLSAMTTVPLVAGDQEAAGPMEVLRSRVKPSEEVGQ